MTMSGKNADESAASAVQFIISISIAATRIAERDLRVKIESDSKDAVGHL